MVAGRERDAAGPGQWSYIGTFWKEHTEHTIGGDHTRDEILKTEGRSVLIVVSATQVGLHSKSEYGK